MSWKQRRRKNASRRRSQNLTLGVVLVGLHVAILLLTFVWTPYTPSDPSGDRLERPSMEHLLGTDRLGRDLSTRIMVGTRMALTVGFGSVGVGALLGVSVGILAAFATRLLDDTLAVLLDILIAFPTLLLAMLVVAAQGGGSLGGAILAIGIAISAVLARLTRIVTKRVLRADYVTAALTSGTSWSRIVIRHVLPNIWPILVVNLSLQFGRAIIAEASLSYLGLGPPPPNISWGSMLQEAQGTVFVAPVGAIAPGIALVTLVIGMNFIADGLRDVLDPTRSSYRGGDQ